MPAPLSSKLKKKSATGGAKFQKPGERVIKKAPKPRLITDDGTSAKFVKARKKP